jgi:energy-coupling factor transporter ATP-binding protein EcfA2
MMSIKFARLSVHDWRQFSNVTIDFHPRLTIVTGANGAGKSTLLRLLAQHFGWHMPLLSTPRMSKSGAITYSTGLWEWLRSKSEPLGNVMGEIMYTNGSSSALRVQASGGVQLNVQIDAMQSVLGMNINSHRMLGGYQQINSIPTSALGAQQAYSLYSSEVMQRYQNSYTQFSPVYRMKEAIISMATFGPGNQYVQPNHAIAELFEGFKDVLRKVLPPSIGFKDISIRIPDVVLETESGDFVIDSSSGGIMSLIDLAWQIFLFSYDKDEYVVILDEPENHLHPTMQRSILGSLLSAFPGAQFVIATHSPFVVSSVKDSNVYVLGYDKIPGENGQTRSVHSVKLDQVNKAGSASEILRDVLGVPVTLPEWAEIEIKEISSEFSITNLNGDSIAALRHRLDSAGLGEYYPDALKLVANQK